MFFHCKKYNVQICTNVGSQSKRFSVKVVQIHEKSTKYSKGVLVLCYFPHVLEGVRRVSFARS